MEGTLLGLKLKTNDMNAHILERIKKGKGILTKLKRFSKLTPPLKTILIKTLLISVSEYPPIPMCSASKTQLIKLQRVQNRALKFINYNDEERIETIKELHEKYIIMPINVSLHNKATKIWETLKNTDEETYNKLVRPIEGNHNWFPRTSYVIPAPVPEPIYSGS